MNWYDYGFRYYDPQLGRFPSLDPLADEFSHLSPYNYASNNPITCVDLWGLQGVPAEEIRDEQGNISGYTAAQDATFLESISIEDLSLNENSEETFGESVVNNLGNAAGLVEGAGMILENPALKKAAGNIGTAIDVIEVFESAVTTDFSSSEETAVFVEGAVQTAVEAVAGSVAGPLAPAVNVILENGKAANGLTNLDNNRLHDNFSTNKNRQNAYSKIMQYNSSSGQ